MVPSEKKKRAMCFPPKFTNESQVYLMTKHLELVNLFNMSNESKL